ncbi:lipase family protein [Aquibaculum sediminis]|uniref:lipase family protein n=1 Tax=Aquibaculum sediminis TaxID=3231907 RepID=UPI003451CAE5
MKTNKYGMAVGGGFLTLVLASAAAAGNVPQGPDGAAFYDPADPLPSGARGDVIYARAMDETKTMALPSAARNSLVLYHGLSDRDQPIPLSGSVSVPEGAPPEGGWPVIVWTHGTSGMNPRCAPSLDTADGPEHGYVSAMAELLDGFVQKGYAVVAADYQGLGVVNHQPFLQGVPTGRSALDMLTAGHQVEADLGTRYVVMGHSQGGQVDLFASSLGPEYVPQYDFLGTVAFAPASHLADRLDAMRQSDSPQPALAYVLYILQSYATTHSAINLYDILTLDALDNLPRIHDDCVTAASTSGYWTTVSSGAQFLEAPDLEAFRSVAASNEPGELEIDRPAMIVQGAQDHTVLPSATDSTVRRLCESGNFINYQVFAQADHRGALRYGADAAHSWVQDLFAGNEVQSNCASLPSAAQS